MGHGSVVSLNNATGDGGGFAVAHKALIVLQHSSILYVHSIRRSILPDVHSENRAGLSGGGVLLADEGRMGAFNVVFERNTAKSFGGALHASHTAEVLISDCVVRCVLTPAPRHHCIFHLF